MTSNIDINVSPVSDNNARTITSLVSLSPIVSDVAITAAAMAPSSSALTMFFLLAGTASRLASADNCAPPATSFSRMADNDNDVNNNCSARGVASPALYQPSRADNIHLTPPNCCLFDPTLTVVPSSPCGPPRQIVPAPVEVEQRVPPR